MFGENQEVGASLSEKYELAVSDIPAEVLNVINEARPGVNVTGAEKELKHGNTYIDVETLDDEGNEIEFDMLLDGDDWKIAEIQRDLALSELPEVVESLFTSEANGMKPARIIESDQGDGIIIYEFYLVSNEGLETKKEVKFSGGEAEILKEEWKH